MKHEKMNVYQITLVLICLVTAAKGNFPAVIFDWTHSLSIPEMLPISDTEVEVRFTYSYNCLYAACPPPALKQLKDNEMPEILVPTKITNAERCIPLDAQPRCELQPQVTFELEEQALEHSKYQIGYRIFHGELDDSGSIPYSSRDENTLEPIFTLAFNSYTKNPISVQYDLPSNTRFISTASHKKHTFVYQKNKNILEFDLESLYDNFIHQILRPKMLMEKYNNPFAHNFGIQKVQLATPDDFPIDTWKMATYCDINTVPIWRVLLLRWNAIEIYLRNVFKRGEIDIKINTGIHGTFELAERYYENNEHKLHIPKYVWKLITPNDSKYRRAMLIVMHNDPFTEHQEPLCEDICAINGWLVSNKDYRTGLVYCCEMTENIAEILGYSYYEIYSLTKMRNGMEHLREISRILSDPEEKLYDW